MLQIIVLCLFVAAVRGQTTAVAQCINNEGELPINTYVRGCITPPCLLPQLEYATIDMVFRSPRTIMRLRTLAEASINFGIVLTLNYDLGENAVTCDFLSNTYCPVLKDEVVQYTLRVFIERFFPLNTEANMEFRIVDEFNVPIVCTRVHVRVGPPISALSSNGTVV